MLRLYFSTCRHPMVSRHSSTVNWDGILSSPWDSAYWLFWERGRLERFQVKLWCTTVGLSRLAALSAAVAIWPDSLPLLKG